MMTMNEARAVGQCLSESIIQNIHAIPPPQNRFASPVIRPTRRFELIELTVPAGFTGTKFNFTDIPQLRTQAGQIIHVQAIESYTVADVSLSPNGIAVITVAQSLQTFVVLNVNSEENIFRVPYVSFHRIDTSAVTLSPFVHDLFYFDDLKSVDWTKSFVQFSAPPAVLPFSVLLGVHYIKTDEQGRRVQ